MQVGQNHVKYKKLQLIMLLWEPVKSFRVELY